MKRLGMIAWALLALTLLLVGCGPDMGREVSLGAVTAGVYRNDYLDVEFAPEGWEMHDSADLQETIKGVSSMLRGTELEKQLEELTQVMDFQGLAPDGSANVNVIYTQMPAKEWAANQGLSDEEAMAEVLQQQEAIFNAYRSVGIQPETAEICTVTYRGEQRTGLKIRGAVQEIPCYILQIHERTLGPCAVVVTMTAFREDTTANIAEMFKKPIM